MDKVRLAIVDDHALFRAGLIKQLSQMEEFLVVGEAGDGQGALEVIRRMKPDIVLLDVNFPGLSGIDVGAIKGVVQGGSTRVIMLTSWKDDYHGAITAEADGTILKDAEPEDLRKAILLVYHDVEVQRTEVMGQDLEAAPSDEKIQAAEGGLSSRELEVLICLAQGKTTNQIAEELFISDNTVKTHVRHILEKLEASNRAEAVSKATQMGLI